MRLITYFSLIATAVTLGLCSGAKVPTDVPVIAKQPDIIPDYTDIVLPPNIAPLNFTIEEDGDDFAVRISGESGQSIMVSARHGDVRIPEKAWKTLLGLNRGKRLSIVVYVLRQDRWYKFKAARYSRLRRRYAGKEEKTPCRQD